MKKQRYEALLKVKQLFLIPADMGLIPIPGNISNTSKNLGREEPRHSHSLAELTQLWLLPVNFDKCWALLGCNITG